MKEGQNAATATCHAASILRVSRGHAPEVIAVAGQQTKRAVYETPATTGLRAPITDASSHAAAQGSSAAQATLATMILYVPATSAKSAATWTSDAAMATLVIMISYVPEASAEPAAAKTSYAVPKPRNAKTILGALAAIADAAE